MVLFGRRRNVNTETSRKLNKQRVLSVDKSTIGDRQHLLTSLHFLTQYFSRNLKECTVHSYKFDRIEQQQQQLQLQNTKKEEEKICARNVIKI
jgi:hypothetical protein